MSAKLGPALRQGGWIERALREAVLSTTGISSFINILYIIVGGLIFVDAFLPVTAIAECTINGVIYPEEAVVSEYQCQNGQWIELVEGESTDPIDIGTETNDVDTDPGSDGDR